MDVTVSVQGRGGGAFGGTPASVEVRVEDWRGMPHKTDDLLSDMAREALEVYEGLMREQRVLDQSRAERADARKVRTGSDEQAIRRAQDQEDANAWRRWADGMTPDEVGDWDTFVVAVSHGLGELDSDWLDAAALQADPSPLPILDRIAARVTEIVAALVDEVEAGALDAVNERFGTMLGDDSEARLKADVDGLTQAPSVTGNVTTYGPEGVTTREVPDVPVLPDPDVLEVTAKRVDVLGSADGRPMAVIDCPYCKMEHRHALIFAGPGTTPLQPPCGASRRYRILCDVDLLADDEPPEPMRASDRCARIGEHEPHAWGVEGTRWCGGEVF